MRTALVVIVAIAALGALYVLFPLAADTFSRYRSRRTLKCPETGEEAEVQIDASRAAWGAVLGKTLLRVKDCSLWPERKGCGKECLKSSEKGV